MTDCTASSAQGTVVDISFSGVSTQYLVDLPGLGRWGVFEQNLDIDDEDLRPGDQVTLSWDSRHAFGLAGDDDLHEGMEGLGAPDADAATGSLSLDSLDSLDSRGATS